MIKEILLYTTPTIALTHEIIQIIKPNQINLIFDFILIVIVFVWTDQ